MYLSRPCLPSLFVIILLAISAIPSNAQVVIGTVNTDGDPESGAMNAAANKFYVANLCGTDPNCQSPTGTVSVVDGASFAVQTVPTNQYYPFGVAVNPATNKTYVGTCGSSDATCYSRGEVMVIDGATLATQHVPVGIYIGLLAVNTATNTIYVVNQCGTDPLCASNGTVTVINGADLSTRQVNVGAYPYGLAVNSATNKIYVGDACGNDLTCSSNGTVTVIDGSTLQTQKVNVGFSPVRMAVNSTTNKVYVVNNCGTSLNCTDGTMTVIDGNTLGVQTVRVDLAPSTVAVNAVTNKIYVGNDCGTDPDCASASTLSIIDGSGLSSSHIPVCDSQSLPSDVEVNPVTNKVYLTCLGSSGTLTMVDGATNGTTTVAVGDSPTVASVNALTNRIFVPNSFDDTVSVVAGADGVALQFNKVTSCRLVDTREPNGGGPIQGGTWRSYIPPQLGNCDIPDTAAAYSLNVTVVPQRPLGYLTIWPTGQDQPDVSTLNSYDRRIKANAAIVPAGYQGAVSVFVTDTTHLILDIDGYFTASGGEAYEFYPLTPCRVIDTRDPVGDLGGPYLHGGGRDGSYRDFPVRESPCIPANAEIVAYSMNFTVVPSTWGQPLGYLTVWPQGELQPYVSTLNNPTSIVVANAAIVAAGVGGGVSAFAYDDTHLIADINGYFGPAGQGGFSFYPAAPCRTYDTRLNGGPPFQYTRIVDVAGSPCAPPSEAQAYVFNATVVPAHGLLGYLTLWPDGQDRPLVSTLNAYDGMVTSNMAIVPTLNGSIDAFATDLTHLILDISGFFAPESMQQGQSLSARPVGSVEAKGSAAAARRLGHGVMNRGKAVRRMRPVHGH